ncbi:MAG: DUF2239 family protein [Spirochaetales bacterium]|nr:DUF2239 family protein [Spirochaetales bacterium]
MKTITNFTAFAGHSLIASGDLRTILTLTKKYLDSGQNEPILIFNDETGRQHDFNMQGTLQEVLDRAMDQPQKGPGRPKLGVINKEVSLLPRHWEWLNRQQHRASGTIRRLVEAAQKEGKGNRAKALLEAAGNFMWAMTGNFKGFEEASRALYARKWEKLEEIISSWPADVKNHLLGMIQKVKDSDKPADKHHIEIFSGNKRKDSPAYSNPWELSASDLALEITKGKLTALAVMDAHLNRIRQVNKRLNAVTTLFDEEARNAAKELDLRIAKGEKPGPLAGIPFTVKENMDVAGYPTTHGVPAFKQVVPPADAPIVKKLRDAGAIPIGHTNLPDLSLRFHTNSQLYGPTLNPWDPGLTPGGSSGGEGAAIATGMSAFGLGNDAGGSIRLPALFNGITGLKPGYGRLPSDRSIGPRDTMLASQIIPVDGILARSVKDLFLIFSLLAGPDPRDPRAVPSPVIGQAPIKPIRVAVAKDPGNKGVHPDSVQSIKRAAGVLAEQGYIIEEIDLPNINEIVGGYGNMVMTEFSLIWPAFKRFLSEDGQKYLELAMAANKPVGLEEYLQATMRRQGFQREWSLFFEKYPIVIGPVFTEPIVPPDFDIRGPEEYAHIANAMRLCTATSFIGVPAVSVPTGIVNGSPRGVQVIASFYREDLCLEAAALIEEKLGIFTPIDPAEPVT